MTTATTATTATTKDTITEAMATEFQLSLADPTAPWAPTFQSWARERGLSEDLARSVRIAIVRRRVFGAIGRHQPRPRRPRCR